VFSPVSKVKLESYKLEIEKYFQHENKALVSKLVHRLESNGRQTTEYCRFCRNNGEKEEVYMSHITKEASGNVQCPILRKYTCPKCGESGDKAHTISYCPSKKLKRKASEEQENHEDDDPRIPKPMIGHLINRMMIESNYQDREL